MNKKAMALSTIIGLIILLVLLALIAFQLRDSSKRFQNTTTTLQTCGQSSIAKGHCVASKGECESLGGNFWQGLGCKDPSPYCCTDIPGTGIDGGIGARCSWSLNNWRNCDQCQVSMVEAQVTNAPVPIGYQPYVRCATNRIGASCFKSATITGPGGTIYCALDDKSESKPEDRLDDNYASFLCSVPSEYGTYTVTCELSDDCCVPKGAEKATATFKYG